MNGPDGDYIDATCYAQVEPDWGYGSVGAAKSLRGANVVRLTQTHPRQPIGGTVLVKLALRLPRSVFLPLQPPAAYVPKNAAQSVVLEVVE